MSETKIKTREMLSQEVADLKAKGVVVGFTSGVFDLIHPGHVAYLEHARRECDYLIVGINSDASVKLNKGIHRPIVDERSRALVVSGLESVSAVFIFDEQNNNQNIEVLKPSVYLKAGDYSKGTLSSAPIVESYGGKVTIVPMKEGYSSSSIIKKIASQYGERHGVPHGVTIQPKPALFVDRDGTIIEHVEYLHEPSKLKCIPGALEGLKAAQDKGYRIIIVTNQPGIGLGYFTKEDLFAVNRELMKQASKVGLGIDKIYYCPHSKSDHCSCRKPGTGLIERAIAELQVDVAQSFVIGDMTSDIELGKRSGANTVLVKTGRAGEDKLFEVTPDYTVSSLAEIGGILPIPQISTVKRIQSELPIETLEVIGDVAGKIGHDFNNLLGSLVGGIDLIKSKAGKLHADSNPFEKPISLIQNALLKATELTTRIRGYLRSGDIEISEVELDKVFEDVARSVTKVLPDVVIHLDRSEGIKVQSNQFFLGRIIFSLIENSTQSYPKGTSKEVSISVREDLKRGQVQIEVSDRGKGMSSTELVDALKPLGEMKHGGVGTGFGLSLAMAHALMERMGGTLAVSSEKGVGTRVFLTVILARVDR